MEKIVLNNRIKTFGKTVTTFPAGISEAFNELMKATGDDTVERDYYGISYMENGKMIYKAVTEEKHDGEAEKFNYPETIIIQGEYYAEPLKDWRNKTECIKDIFEEMMKDEHVDKMKPAIEWYKSNDEMLCMLRAL